MQVAMLIASATLAAATATSPAQATLVMLDNQQVLDTATHLVWLHDWGQGGGDWQSAMTWADALSIDGHNDWGLPTVDQYLSVWASAGSSLSGLQAEFDNVDPFAAIGSPGYWTSDTAAPGGGGPRAEIFLPQTGTHYTDYTFWAFAATAVRPAPEPSIDWLVAIGLVVALAITRQAGTRSRFS